MSKIKIAKELYKKHKNCGVAEGLLEINNKNKLHRDNKVILYPSS